ncbi:MAG: transketolase [Clostridiales bacterium]|nr:transketolase [Clostridiales bacterium]
MEKIDKLAVTSMRMLSLDAIQKAKSGHPGMAVGAAPMAYTLWKNMRHDPADPKWQGRDRFILSAGHASMLLYSLMHIFGYPVSMDDIKDFRQLGAKTAGHPEFGHIPGIEATTGPLGQGFAMAVGMAMAERHLAARFDRDGFNVIDNYTYTLMGDGCMMEGVASEAASLAGTLGLGKLIALYDRNRITIEGSTDIAFTEDVGKRFEAYGWQVIEVASGEDTDAVEKAIAEAKADKSRPSLIIVNTNIAEGTPKQGSASSHGSPLGEENIRIYKEKMGWDHPDFTVPDEVYAHMAAFRENAKAMHAEHDRLMDEYKKAYPELWYELNAFLDDQFDHGESDPALWEFDKDTKLATRKCSEIMLTRLTERLPNLIGGSADLGPSNLTYMKAFADFSKEDPAGRNFHFGIREFAMAAIANGMALYGGIRPYCATFLVFADYMKPALRLSSLMGLNVIYVLTHDSIGVGEDGPTHQPIEQLDMLRATPNTYVFRPADGRETCASYLAALKLKAPAVLALSRQNLPQIEGTGEDAMKGGYILRDSKGLPELIIMASGSEVEPALKAYGELTAKGVNVRLVSMPCMELFEEQPWNYREKVLPNSCRARVAAEALGGMSFNKYLGLDGRLVSMKSFGASAPAGKLFEKFAINAEAIKEAAEALL